MQEFIIINKSDNVAVALTNLDEGKTIQIGSGEVKLREPIPSGHKFSLKTISEAENVIKYGCPIGIAKENIEPGTWVHTHNIKTALGDVLDYTYQPSFQGLEKTKPAFFKGFRRSDSKEGTSKVGIRNEIWIIPTVGCVNAIASSLEKQASSLIKGSVESVIAFPHPYGCSQMGDDQENTRFILADLINHPNAGGVLVLGLGCENSNIAELKPYIGNYDENRVKFLQCQDVEDEMETAMELIEELIDYAAKFEREDISTDELIIGMKCGGSDGLSGITANPLVGYFSDMLISKGGTTILTEVPEMFGAETLLMNRCPDEELFQKTVAMINNFKKYFSDHNQVIYENPSPGNKKGGISTLEDKSLGCTQKSGNAPVADVLSYGERVKTKGLNLLSAPGNDLVAATALAAAGAHIVLFTTGRGTPFSSPVPTIKISSNSNLANKKNNWIDFNAGRLVDNKLMEVSNEEKNQENSALEENISLEDLTKEFFQYIIDVASGKKVKSEEAGYHDMAIFKNGVTL